jgi:hypothetical protein
MSEIHGNSAELSKLGTSNSVTVSCPTSVSVPFVSLAPSVSSNVGLPDASAVSRLRPVGGNRPFPNLGSLPASIRYITSLRATKYLEAGLALKIPTRAIPHHERDDILEVKVVRCLEPQREFILYTKHNPGRKRADLDLYQFGAKYGEEFWVTSIRKHPIEEFPAEYNRMKPRGLENTELLWEDGLRMRVDEAELELKVRAMRTYESRLFLDADLGNAGLLRFKKDLCGFSVRTKDRSLVQSLTTDGRNVLMMYKQPRGRMHVRVITPTRLTGVEKVAPMVRFRDGVQIVSRPDSFEGEYVVRVNPKLVAQIMARLASHYTCGYTKERGDIGEELIDAILWQAGCPQLLSHPLDPGRDFDSSRKGPDSLREVPISLLAYFELKWWKEADVALCEAREQASGFPREDVYADGPVVGAYIANLDWDLGSSIGSLIVSRVW